MHALLIFRFHNNYYTHSNQDDRTNMYFTILTESVLSLIVFFFCVNCTLCCHGCVVDNTCTYIQSVVNIDTPSGVVVIGTSGHGLIILIEFAVIMMCVIMMCVRD